MEKPCEVSFYAMWRKEMFWYGVGQLQKVRCHCSSPAGNLSSGADPFRTPRQWTTRFSGRMQLRGKLQYHAWRKPGSRIISCPTPSLQWSLMVAASYCGGVVETSSHPSGKRWTSQNLIKHLCRDLKTNGSDPTRQSLVIVGCGESPRFFFSVGGGSLKVARK